MKFVFRYTIGELFYCVHVLTPTHEKYLMRNSQVKIQIFLAQNMFYLNENYDVTV